jgi:starch-binding outer membrane protein, SusD/RagB family
MMRLKFPRYSFLVVAALSTACNSLEVASPTITREGDIDNPVGAELLRTRVVIDLSAIVPIVVLDEGMLADEFFADTTPASLGSTNFHEIRDRRSEQAEWANFGFINRVRNEADRAREALRKVGASNAYIGQMFAYHGFAKLLIAQSTCPGFAFNEIIDDEIVYRPALTTEQAFQSALNALDSAVVYTADSARILNFARVARGRVLLELGKFPEAAAAVAAVPTTYAQLTEHSTTPSQLNSSLFNIAASSSQPKSVSDREGTNGLNFVSAADPRVKTLLRKKTASGLLNMYSIEKYPTNTTGVPIVTGIEARLIEAEAALKAGNTTQWLTLLNQLRATGITPAMAALADPGTADARVDLMFRERAFWLFATAHRLADLRRLVRQYGRSVNQVFPTGPYRLGNLYGNVTTFKFGSDELVNPAVTGCTSR